MTHYKVRPKPRPRQEPPGRERCGERACGERWEVECWLVDDRRGDLLAGRYCSDHAELNGFCRHCGVFSAGLEGFEFGRPSGVCDTCRSSYDDVDDWGDDGTGVTESAWLDYGYLDEEGEIDRKVDLLGGR